MSLLVALCDLRHRGRWRPLTGQADMIWRTNRIGRKWPNRDIQAATFTQRTAR